MGSTVVKELRGTESTRKSIQKLKKGERVAMNAGGNTDLSIVHHGTGQAVFIFISYRGVQFVDIQTQVIIVLIFISSIKIFSFFFTLEPKREQSVNMKSEI